MKSHELANQLLALPDLPVWIRVDDDTYDGEVRTVKAETESVRIPQNVGSRYEQTEIIALGTE